jgi:hypothetical protein
MITREDLESFILRLGKEHEEIEEGMWVVGGPEDGTPVVVDYAPPVVLLRLKVLRLPAADEGGDRLAAIYRRVLELNATDIVHGSYGVDGEDLILSDALELEGLDFQELRTSYESLLFAASSHLPALAELLPVAHEG